MHSLSGISSHHTSVAAWVAAIALMRASHLCGTRSSLSPEQVLLDNVVQKLWQPGPSDLAGHLASVPGSPGSLSPFCHSHRNSTEVLPDEEVLESLVSWARTHIMTNLSPPTQRPTTQTGSHGPLEVKSLNKVTVA